MIDKVIIDGVDIRECEHECQYFNKKKKGKCKIPFYVYHIKYTGCNCSEVKDCYFKQLARAKDKIDYMEEYIQTVENARNDLEREVEKWKHQAELGSDTTDRLSKELEDKNREIEKLKSELSETMGAIDNIRKSKEHWQKVSITDSQDVEGLSEENKKLKTQLMEKSEVDMFFSTPIEGWDNDPCKICQYKQDYKQKEQECEELKTVIEEIKQEIQEDITCESQECGCDNYEECIECLKNTILNIILINKENTAPTTIFDRIRSFDSDTFAKFIHSLIKCSENLTCDDCYIAALPFPKRICDTKETLSDIQNWLNEECEDDNNAR